MAKERLEDLSNESLNKRKKFVFFIIGICIGTAIVSLGIMVWKGKSENFLTLIPGLSLILIAGIMFKGTKKIDEELARRNDK